MFKDGNLVVPNYTQSARTLLYPVENDESPHSTQSTISSSDVSEQQPEGLSDFDKLSSPRNLDLLSKALNEHPPAYQSSALVSSSLPTPSGESVEGAFGSSRFVWTPPAAPPQNALQLPSSYSSGLTFSIMLTPDKVGTRCNPLATLNQPLPTPANNAAERRSSPSGYSYLFDLAPPHNHLELPFSYGRRTYPSKP